MLNLLGNDIIDLARVHEHPRSAQDRFHRKVMTREEHRQLGADHDPATDIWMLWALKESAYKCYFQRTGHRFFAPQKFACRWQTDSSGEASWYAEIHTPAGIYSGMARRSSGYIYALSAGSSQQLAEARSRFFYLPGLQAREQSRQLRVLALTWLADPLALPGEELKWEDSAGYPRLSVRGEVLRTALSLSHHGDWGAVATLS